MIRMQVIVDSFEEFRENYPLWSKIYIKVGEYYFPEKEWTDATSSVLVTWAEQIISMMNDGTRMVELFFMDGNYSIRLIPISATESSVHLIGPNGLIISFNEVDVFYFARQVLSACGKLSKQYQTFYNAQQLQEVSSVAEQLRRLIVKRCCLRKKHS